MNIGCVNFPICVEQCEISPKALCQESPYSSALSLLGSDPSQQYPLNRGKFARASWFKLLIYLHFSLLSFTYFNLESTFGSIHWLIKGTRPLSKAHPAKSEGLKKRVLNRSVPPIF